MCEYIEPNVAIHNKNGKGLLRQKIFFNKDGSNLSQSTIKMEKGYYAGDETDIVIEHRVGSQSTIKMEKGYYLMSSVNRSLLLFKSQSTIKMEKGYYPIKTRSRAKAKASRNPQ